MEGSYFRFISVLFSLRFLHRFFVAFWCDFGAIWGAFGEPKSNIFGIDFPCARACALTRRAHVRSHGFPARTRLSHTTGGAPRAAKRAARAGKSDPRGPQDARKESEKITRAVHAKQAAEKRAKR